MDWELSRQHLISGYVPFSVFLLGLFLVLHVIGKRQRWGHVVLSFVFSFYLIGILTMTGIWYRSAFDPRIVYIPFADMVDDLEELIHVINNQNLTEFQYLVDGDEWSVFVK